MVPGSRPPLQLEVDGRQVEVPDVGQSLLAVLREDLGLRSPKDGCSPQGQCGCCTVLVDGSPRVACVTPARRVAGRTITTADGLAEGSAAHWADAFTATGASQCGFCTPGIICRLEGLRAKDPTADRAAVG
jgi:xanthine dehydrogenase small subunit